MDVEAWLKELGLEAFTEAFAENGVDADLLLELTKEDLKDLGVLRLADRKRLLKAIADLTDLADHHQPSEARQPALLVAEGERRQVTVLFADIAGFTRLSSELGAEQTHAVLNRYFDTVDALVESYGGKVDKHIGDSVMAVFGAPVAHDDDPIRAVRTALEIHERMAALSQEAGCPLKAHIGIACGQVVASGTGSDAYREYTVTGDSVNLASRLQDKADPGQTLISDALRQMIAQSVDCDALDQITVKGIADPGPVWRVKSLRGSGERSPGIAFVGRRAEVAQFAGVVEACRTEGAGQAIYVRGEAGIGKTSLVEVFTKIAVDNGFVAHKGLVLDFGVSKGQDAIRAVVRSLLRVASGSRKSARLAAADAAIAHGLLSPEQRAFLSDLLDLPQSREERTVYDAMDNATRNEGRRAVVADLMRQVSADRPTVIIVEDVHWANPLMLTHLAKLAATVADCPALLVMTSRIDGDPLDQAWRSMTGGCSIMTMDLGPLRREDALSLASSFTDTTKDFALDCVQRAEGNPLFLEQLLRNAEETDEKEVPASIQSLVLARADRLSAADKQGLQAASVLGQRFALDALRHLIKSPHYTCAGLIERSLVKPEGDHYLFAHALVQEGVYTSLLTVRRQELHRAAAEWYRERDPVLRAEHLDRADDPMAAAAYLDAAEAQTTLLHFETVLNLTDRGIALAIDSSTRCDLTCLRADALRNTGATEESIAAFEMALECAEDEVRRCRAWIGLAGGLRVADRQKQALDALATAEAIAVTQALVSERAEIHYLRGNVYFPLGNIDGCLEEHEKALGFARHAGSTEGEALALGGLGDAYYLRGHMRSACEQFRACVQVCQENGYGRIEVANRHMIGWTRIHLMEFVDALEDALQSVKMATEVNHHRAEVLGLMLAGRAGLELGRFAEAKDNLRQGLDLARTIGTSNFEAQLLLLLGRLSAIEEKTSEARDLVEQAVSVVRTVGMTFIGPTVLATKAALVEDRNEARIALQEAEKVLDTGCVAHNHVWFAETAIDYALAINDWGEAERYAARLEAYTRGQALDWPDFLIARARALAVWGRGVKNEDVLTEIRRLHEIAMARRVPFTGQKLAEALAAA